MTQPLDRRTFLKGTAAAAAGLAVPGALAGCAAGPGAARPGTAAAPTPVASRSALPVRLDMVHFNPGEPPTVSSFNDPEKLAAYGYTGKVVNDFQFVSAAVTFDSFDRRVFPAGSDERAWVEALARGVDAEIEACHAAGVEAVFWMDVVVLPKRLVDLYGDELTDAEGRLSIRRPRTQEVQRALIAEVFERFPDIDGLCVRTGETYLDAVPHHTGAHPIPDEAEVVERAGSFDVRRAEAHALLLGLLRDEVCEERGKRLIYRTWGWDGFHTDPAYYLAAVEPVAPHPLLLLSVKHTEGDFHRTMRVNPTLGIGPHAQVVEVQCQREYEGKGAHPNYVAAGVIDGFEENAPGAVADGPGVRSLRALLDRPQFRGLWTWSRGGGWVGPRLPVAEHPASELWCDLNAYVLSHWALDTDRAEADVFADYTRERLGLSAADAARFSRIALDSARGVVRGHSSLLVPVHVWWMRDEFMSGLVPEDAPVEHPSERWGDLTDTFDRILAAGLADAVLAEKAEAVAIWDEIAQTAREITTGAEPFRQYLVTSSDYGRAKYAAVESGWTVMLRGYAGDQTGDYDRPAIRAALGRYDAAWAALAEVAARPEAATPYVPFTFEYLPPDYQSETWGIGRTVDRYRALVG